MSSSPVKKIATKKAPYGGNALASVAAIELVLDNGEDYTLDVDKETLIPEDLDHVMAASIYAPGRLAFIGGQVERALFNVRVAEANLSKLEGDVNRQARLKIEADRDGEMVAENAVQAAVDCRKDVVASRLRLAELRLHYGLLRSLHEAASHRVWIMTRLLDQVAKSH